jgi:type IV secretion system protein VirD4
VVHPVVASVARELLNKSENERSGVVSTAMSFLGLYRDPLVAANTASSDWRIADLTTGDRPVSLYLVVPPSDISRTRPLVRLILNQIARRLTETLPDGRAAARPRLLLMLDEFPALGRLDFFETSLAFLAGYGVRAFLVAQSLHQIDRAYGANHAILDNCHVRVAFAPNDERTARRLSDALGTTTELRHHRNVSGQRLSLFLPHVSLAEQETPRPLLTAGEILQLPQDDALVLVSGTPPIRARKLRYYADRNFLSRLLPAPPLGQLRPAAAPASRTDDWSGQTRATHAKLERAWSDLVTTSTGRTPEQAPALDIAHEGLGEPQRHDPAGDTQAEPGAEPEAQPAHDDDDLAPLLERP